MSYQTKEFDGRLTAIISSGGAGFMPSDTTYGLSALAANPSAVEKVHKLKERSSHKPFIVLINDLSQLEGLGVSLEEVKLALPYWPGALTIICAAPKAPAYLERGTDSLAVRLPADKGIRDLIAKTGPIISTSANLEGQPIIQSADKAYEVFGDGLDFYVDAGVIGNLPSTIVKNVDGKLMIVREGTVKIVEGV
jgi:L-threonylcarbamoyladenylate synthase